MKLSTLIFASFFLGVLQYLGPGARLPPARFLCRKAAPAACSPQAARAVPHHRGAQGSVDTRFHRLREVTREIRNTEAALRAVEREEARVRKALGLAGGKGAPFPPLGGEAVFLSRLESLERQRLALEEFRSGLEFEAAVLSGGGTRGPAPPFRKGTMGAARVF